MKPIYNKTGLENLLELIRQDNPSAIITAEQILEVPISGVDGVTGRTTAVLVAKTDAGYSGTITIDWLRRTLDQYVTEGEFVQVLEGEGEVDVKNKIAQAYNLVLDDLEWTGFSVPGLTENQAVVFSIQGNEGLVYGDTQSVSLIISTVDISTGARGFGSTLRITSNGLVRGIVEGSTGPVGPGDTPIPGPDGTYFYLSFIDEIYEGMVEAPNPVLHDDVVNKLVPVKDAFNYGDAVYFVPQLDPAQTEMVGETFNYEPYYFEGVTSQPNYIDQNTTDSIFSMGDNHMVPFVYRKPTVPISFDIIANISMPNPVPSHNPDLPFFIFQIGSTVFKWTYGSGEDVNPMVHGTITDYNFITLDNMGVIEIDSSVSILTFKVRDYDHETGSFTVSVNNGSIQLREFTVTGQDIGYNETTGYCNGFKAGNRPFGEDQAIYVNPTPNDLTAGQTAMSAATYGVFVEDHYSFQLNTAFRIKKLGTPQKIYFELFTNQYNIRESAYAETTLSINGIGNMNGGAQSGNVKIASGVPILENLANSMAVVFAADGLMGNYLYRAAMGTYEAVGVLIDQENLVCRMYIPTDAWEYPFTPTAFTTIEFPIPEDVIVSITGQWRLKKSELSDQDEIDMFPDETYFVSLGYSQFTMIEWLTTAGIALPTGWVSLNDANSVYEAVNPLMEPLPGQAALEEASDYNYAVYAGGSIDVDDGSSSNIFTAISVDNAYAVTESTISTPLTGRAASNSGGGIFFGGGLQNFATLSMTTTNEVTLVDGIDAVNATSTFVSISRAYTCGLLNGLFYGGFNGDMVYNYTGYHLNLALILTSSGEIANYEYHITRPRSGGACGIAGQFSVLLGGSDDELDTDVLIFEYSGARLGHESVIDINHMYSAAGAGAGTTALFYGGYAQENNNPPTVCNYLSRMDRYANVLSSNVALGTARSGIGGASVGDRGVFFGGTLGPFTANGFRNELTVINEAGTLVVAETTVGTARYGAAGVGVNG